MNLLPTFKNKQTGHIGTSAESTPNSTLLGDLNLLRKLIDPMRERMDRYDEAIKALAIARDRMIDVDQMPPPEMTLAVQRELLVARGDTRALKAFDVEFDKALQTERATRESILREREELPARIQALEILVKQIAAEMRDHFPEVLEAQEIVVELYKPFAKDAYEAAQGYIKAVQRAHTASHALASVIKTRRYDLFGDYKETIAPELYGVRGTDVLPTGLPGYGHAEISDLTYAVDKTDPAFHQQLRTEIEAAGLHCEDLRTYGPPADNDTRRIYVPEGLVPQRIKQSPTPASHAFTAVTI